MEQFNCCFGVFSRVLFIAYVSGHSHSAAATELSLSKFACSKTSMDVGFSCPKLHISTEFGSVLRSPCHISLLNIFNSVTLRRAGARSLHMSRLFTKSETDSHIEQLIRFIVILCIIKLR